MPPYREDDPTSTVASSDISSDDGSRNDLAEQLAAAENRRVKLSKFIMFAVLVAAALGCSYATYAVSRRGEDREFKAKVSVGHRKTSNGNGQSALILLLPNNRSKGTRRSWLRLRKLQPGQR